MTFGGSYYDQGIFALLQGGSLTTNDVNFSSSATVSSMLNIVGVIGHCNSSTSITMTSWNVSCSFTGGYGDMAGIVGYLDTSTLTITSLTHSGTITATSMSGTSYRGGMLIGYSYSSTLTLNNLAST